MNTYIDTELQLALNCHKTEKKHLNSDMRCFISVTKGTNNCQCKRLTGPYIATHCDRAMLTYSS
jgi:hypothetical protein